MRAAATKTKILNKAKTLGLVQDATTDQSFSGDLSDAVNGNNTVKTDALEALRAFARNPQ